MEFHGPAAPAAFLAKWVKGRGEVPGELLQLSSNRVAGTWAGSTVRRRCHVPANVKGG